MRKAAKIFLLLLLMPLFQLAQLQVKNLYDLTGKREVPFRVMTQDLNGFVWIASADNLYRFDGREAVSVLGNSPLARTGITALFVDSHDMLWIGNQEGKIFRFDRRHLDSISLPKFESTEKITSFCEIDGIIIAGTYGNGLFVIKGNSASSISTKNGLNDNVIYKISTDGAKKIWCGTDGGVTEIRHLDKKPLFKTISVKDGLADNIVRDIYYTGNKLLLAMQDSGLCTYNLQTERIERSSFFANWSMGAIINVIESEDGTLNIGTEKSGLLQIRQSKISRYDYPALLGVESVQQLFQDREKQLWLVSAKGLSQLFSSRSHLIETGTQSKVLAVAIDNNNGLWLGTSEGILLLHNDEQGRSITKKIAGGDKHIISCASTDKQGNIWFGTYGAGIIVISPDDHQIRNIASAQGLPNENVSSIFFDDSDNVFISTLGGGIVVGKVTENNGRYTFAQTTAYTEKEGLGSNYVYAAITDSDGILYAATDGGALQVLKNGKFNLVPSDEPLKSNSAFSLCRDQLGHIVATSNADGLLHYDGHKLIKFRHAQGLRDEQPQQIIAGVNNLICVHSKGIDRVNCTNASVGFYDVGESNFDPNLNAIVFKGNKIYSGTSKGVLTFRIDQEAADTIKPLVYLKEFFLSYKPFPLDSITEFKHNQNSIGFAFDGIWLKNPNNLLFRYKLVGLENEWQYADEGKNINYNNLSPGSYVFVVQVKNDEDIWSEATGHSFVILTPIWKRWWFWILIVGSGALGLLSFIRYRLKALQRENLLLESRVKERTRQIEKQTRIIEEKNQALEQLSLVASKTDNVVLILDADGKLEYVNESFEKLLGMDLEKVKQTYGDSIYSLSNNPDIKEIVEEAVGKKRSVSYESLNKKSSKGPEIWESSTLTPIFEEDGALRKIIIIDTDVSLRKKQEQIIVQKNKDITDSISYARKIQHAILPAAAQLSKHIPDHFVLYMTKDIVSGDFYWFTHFNNMSIIAAVDCTGHGVPGAFMSLIGYNQLNRIVNEQKHTDPATILELLNNGVLAVLHKNESESKDGMDTAICMIDHKKGTLNYAGAMRPLWIVNDKDPAAPTFTEIKADKIPIGTKDADRESKISYTTHSLQVSSHDTFYIFTDGYADQFGGEKDKKYSTGRFKEFLIRQAGKSFAEQHQNLKEEHLGWKGEHEQIDDILVIGFKTV